MGEAAYPNPSSPNKVMAIDEASDNPDLNIKAADEMTFPMLEVARHTKPNDCWFVIDGMVYDVTKFLDEHPGGEDVLIDSAGGDATRQFEDVGHSNDARAQLAELKVGRLREATVEELEKDRLEKLSRGEKEPVKSQRAAWEFWLKWTFPVILMGVAYLIRKYTT